MIEMTLCDTLSHSRKLLSLINYAVEKIGIDINTIDGYAVSTGPGSFTGLRIGIGTIKGLAMATGKPVVGISTLEALSYSVSLNPALICPILDARKNEVYTSLFRYQDSKLIRLTDDMVISPKELLSNINEKAIFLGDAVSVYKDFILEMLDDQALFLPGSFNHPRGSSVANLGALKFNNGEAVNLNDLKPTYIRRSEAEIKWETKQQH
jgi:tRNA threonylcarbamoyladenosine biosynthesis protein TsaB